MSQDPAWGLDSDLCLGLPPLLLCSWKATDLAMGGFLHSHCLCLFTVLFVYLYFIFYFSSTFLDLLRDILLPGTFTVRANDGWTTQAVVTPAACHPSLRYASLGLNRRLLPRHFCPRLLSSPSACRTWPTRASPLTSVRTISNITLPPPSLGRYHGLRAFLVPFIAHCLTCRPAGVPLWQQRWRAAAHAFWFAPYDCYLMTWVSCI